jgi:hypothetical protein
MNAGRELDALIAEKVFGQWLTSDRLYADHAPIPAYSTDIAAAWQVWRKVPTFTPFEQGMFFSALRAHVAARMDKDYRWTDSAAVLHMDPVDICNSVLETRGVLRTLPDWYYE